MYSQSCVCLQHVLLAAYVTESTSNLDVVETPDDTSHRALA